MVEAVEQLLSRVGSGVTDPINGVINGKRAIIKTLNNEQSNRVLINELVCYRIAKALGLPIPDGGICLINNNTKISANIDIQENQYGLGFFTYRIDKVTNIVDNPTIFAKLISNKADYLKIILFDHIIFNKDRHKGNILISLGQNNNRQLYIIDHTHVFDIGSIWDKYQLKSRILSADFNSTDIMENNEPVYNLLIHAINCSKEALLQEAQKIKDIINKELLQNIINEIPNQWDIDEEERKVLIEYIIYRIENIESICDIIYNYKRRSI